LQIEQMFDKVRGMAPATPAPDREPDEPLGRVGFGEQLALLAELLEASPGELTEGEVADGVVALAKLSGQVDAALGALVGVLDTRAVHVGDGAPSAGAWVAARSELTRQAAGAVAARQRDLRSCPHVADAYRLGLIGTAKVRILLAARHRVEEIFAEHEAELVDTLRPLTVDHARYAAARWRALALDLAGLDDETAPTDPTTNSLHVSATSGRYDLTGDLDVVTGAGFVADLDAEIADLFREGRFATDDGLVRSQRRAVALAELTARARGRSTGRPGTPAPATPSDPADDPVSETDPTDEAGPHGEPSPKSETGKTGSGPHEEPGTTPGETAAGAGTDRPVNAEPGGDSAATAPVLGVGPSVSVVVDLALLAGHRDHPLDLDAALERYCELADGTPIPLSTAQRLLCTGSIDPVLVDRLLDTTDIAGITSPARTATRAQRRALIERDRGCVFPGCRAGSARCEAHHVIPWSHGGATTLTNLALLCRRHHHACHEGGFTLTRTDGTITVTRPDGTTLPRTRHGDQVTEPLHPHDTDTGTGAPPRPPSRYRTLSHRLSPRDLDVLDHRRRRHADARRTRLGLPPPPTTITTQHWRLTRVPAA
jgi:hypothetical protein